MIKTVLFSGLLALASAAPQFQLPAGISATDFPCFPFADCDAPEAQAFFAQQGQTFHAQQRIAAQQFALSQPIVPQVPGLAAHAAAEAQVLAAQGRNPGSVAQNGNEARVRQAEADLIALQQQQAQVQATAFTGLVGPSGVVGPSGLVGPTGPVAF